MRFFKNDENNYFSDNIFTFIFLFLCVSALLIVRGAFFYYESGDYTYFYKLWIEEYRNMTFWEGLGTKVGNYNPPYLYFLNFISRFDTPGFILMKIFSVFFDFILAFFVMKIASLRTDKFNMHILAFLLAFAGPTVILNSSMWGQCDSVYAAFAVGAVYFGMRGKSKSTYIFIALAVSIKLQAALLLPLIPVFILTGKIRLKDCYLFFIVYFTTLLPVLIAGVPLTAVLSVYAVQATSFVRLNLNIVNIWRFVLNVDVDQFITAGLFMTAAVLLGFLYFIYIHRKHLKEHVDFVRLAYLFTIMIPFMLPKMHDRYYYLADVMSVTVFLFDKRRWYVPAVTVFCSYLGYAYFMMSGVELIDYRFAAIALFTVIIIVLRDFVTSLRTTASETTDCIR